MAATKRQFNISPCTFTPTSGSAVTYTGVTGVSTDHGGSLAKFSGDGDRFNTTVINEFNDPGVTITCADYAALQSTPSGARGVLAYTYKDAKGATGGALTVSVSTAIVESVQFAGQHRQYASGSVSFATESSDGVTSPLTFSAA